MVVAGAGAWAVMAAVVGCGVRGWQGAGQRVALLVAGSEGAARAVVTVEAARMVAMVVGAWAAVARAVAAPAVARARAMEVARVVVMGGSEGTARPQFPSPHRQSQTPCLAPHQQTHSKRQRQRHTAARGAVARAEATGVAVARVAWTVAMAMETVKAVAKVGAQAAYAEGWAAAAAAAEAGAARVAVMGGSESTNPWARGPHPQFPSPSPHHRSQTPCLARRQ